MNVSLSTDIRELPNYGPAKANRLSRLGLRTVRDALFFFPREYQEPPPPARIADLKQGQRAAFVGRITDVSLSSSTPGKSVYATVVENESGAVRMLFFNQPFRADSLTMDKTIRLIGSPKLTGLRWEFAHPEVEILEDGLHDPNPPATIVPVYPLVETVKQADVRGVVAAAIEHGLESVLEVMPEELRERAAGCLNGNHVEAGQALVGICAALREIHQPTASECLAAARLRLIFQELLVMQLALATRRRSLTTDLEATPLECSSRLRQRILRRFPFALTDDQTRVVDEIVADMRRQFPMNRMLQGDVGSGKTAVAFFAMLLAVAGKQQAALMAPTEVLARQHFHHLQRLMDGSRVRVGLLCGSLTTSERRQTLREIESGDLDLIIGTHALVYDVAFRSLALVVVDEQHRFGVRQRVQLRGGGKAPHYLVMSATPIPRTVAMTQFGDVALSVLREKPAGRIGVKTYLADDAWKSRWWGFVRERLSEGRQAYVVAPRVGELGFEARDDDEDDIASVTQTYRELKETQLSDYRVELLHGGMAPEDKQSVMDAFAEGEIEVLVSTTVIEVGIDVANATVMTILGANRFGLAQLHQLRGRVARGSHGGHVGVFVDGGKSPRDDERLVRFETTEDGFALAEADYQMRGPGDLLGRRQSGLPPLLIADLQRDQEVLGVARELAHELIEEDPDMSGPLLSLLRDQVFRRYGTRLELGDGA
ncbi:MAG: ATP-dependent DNA helicase RecG [Planctomycetota bacterium]